MRDDRDQPAKKWRASFVTLAVFSGATLMAAACLVFQDNIARFVMNPRTPFQTMTPTPTPNYAQDDAWFLKPSSRPALREAGPLFGADVFYVHSTTYDGNNHWNAPYNHSEALETLSTIAAPNEIGPFLKGNRVFAPLYRQATLYSAFTHKYDSLAAQEAAFADIDRAFEAFVLNSTDEERPIVLVGYGQGGLHIAGLLQKRINQDPVLQRRLAAAYILGQPLPKAFFETAAPKLAPCASEDQTRCVVAYVDYEARFDIEMDSLRRRALSWGADGGLQSINNPEPICVNPLTWSQSEAYAGPANHIGAASATGVPLGDMPAASTGKIGAQCTRGVLVVDRPNHDYLRRRIWFGAKWKAQHFNLFYHDLAADAARRIEINQARLTDEANILAPITNSVDVVDSPVNKVPQ